MSDGCLIIEDEYILTEGESIMSSDFIRQSTDDDDDGVTIKTKKKCQSRLFDVFVQTLGKHAFISTCAGFAMSTRLSETIDPFCGFQCSTVHLLRRKSRLSDRTYSLFSGSGRIPQCRDFFFL